MTSSQATTPAWHLSGDYCETCSCLAICSCSPTGFALPPNREDCTFALVFHVERGQFGATALDDLAVAVVGYTPPGPMVSVPWSVGLIVDERADQAQREALTEIFSGQAGGPMGALAPLITTFLGVEARPIQYQRDGLTRSVTIADTLDQGVEGFASPVQAGAYLAIDGTGHPANARLAAARATHSHLHAFGLDWDDASGRNNGHFAPFAWSA